jgi:hypothetical protein
MKGGIRLGLHEFVNDLPPVGITPRGIATSRWVWGITTCTAKTRDQLSHHTRADGTTLGSLTDGAVLTMVSGQHVRAYIARIGCPLVYGHPVALEAFSARRRFSSRERREKRLHDHTASHRVEL